MPSLINSSVPQPFPLRRVAFLESLRTRLLPEIDLEKSFGRNWDIQLDSLFSKVDRLAVGAIPDGAIPPQWHAIQFGPAAAQLNRITHMHCARSLGQAIASLAGDCSDCGVWPDSVELLNQAPITIELRLAGDLFARITGISNVPTQPAARRQRAMGTLKTLRKNGPPEKELLARLRRWPGMKTLGPHGDLPADPQRSRAHAWHLPTPAERLVSAKQLCDAAGWVNPTPQNLQALVCKIFDQPSWNHLCAAHESAINHWHTSTGMLWSVCIQYGDDEWAEQTSWCHIDVLDGLSHWLMHGADLTKVSPKMELDLTRTLTSSVLGLASFELVTGMGEDNAPAGLPVRILLSPCVVIEADPAWLARAKLSSPNRLRETLVDLFQLNLDLDQRHKFRVAEFDGQFLLRDGPWYFFTDHDGAGAKHLFACLVGEDGNLIGTGEAPCYKGRLTWDKQTRAYVLTADYSYRDPTAFIRGISTESVERLQQYLDQSTELPAHFDLTDSDFTGLLEFMNSNGAVKPW